VASPLVTVVVPARNAAATIGRTLEALSSQEVESAYEVVVADDGSDDETPRIAERAGVKLVRLGGGGAAEARNAAVAAGSGSVLAFTDSDCFPTPGWLAAGLRALDRADVVQGRVEPDVGVPRGPFDRSLWVEGETGLFETANLFVRRDLFDRLGGFEAPFDVDGGRPLGEDVWFGWRARRTGARSVFEAEALVRHAVFPRGPVAHADERRRLEHFPAIVARMPELRDGFLYRRWFLSRRSAAFDLALAGAAMAARRRSPVPFALAWPYLSIAARDARPARRRAPLVMVAKAGADLVGLAYLLKGTARSRTPVL
jgi:glycosyltransferase involved in cell wall biosynthesis